VQQRVHVQCKVILRVGDHVGDKEVMTESKDSDNSAARNRSHDSTHSGQHSKVYQCLRFRINETVG